MVDWPSFFSALARVHFTGPLMLAVEYGSEGELAPVRKDLAFVRKGLAAVYGPL